MREPKSLRFPALAKFPAALLLGAIASMTLYAWAVLHAESQTEVISLFAVAAIAAFVVPRLGLLDPLRIAAVAAPRLLGGGCFVGVLALLLAFHDTHFALLLLATVLLYAVVGLGLNIQLGYCGIVNFAGAAFLVVPTTCFLITGFITGFVEAAAAGFVAGAVAAPPDEVCADAIKVVPATTIASRKNLGLRFVRFMALLVYDRAKP